MTRLWLILVLLIGSSASAAEPAKKVLVIGIDGCRTDALLKADAPHLQRLIKDGAFSDENEVLGPEGTGADTVSGPGWSSILTGVWPDRHGVLDNGFKNHRLADHPSFLDLIEQARPDAQTAAFVSWPPLAERIISMNAGCRLFAAKDLEGYIQADRDVADAAAKLLAEGDPDAVFLYFGQVDETGHKYGFHPLLAQYREAIATVDGHVGRVLEAIRSRDTFDEEDWLIIVGTDHGGRGLSHGGGSESEVVRRTFLIFHGPSVQRGEIEGATANVDIVRTLLEHLDIPAQAKWKLAGKVQALKAQSPEAE